LSKGKTAGKVERGEGTGRALDGVLVLLTRSMFLGG
jgi:hypothetical protein